MADFILFFGIKMFKKKRKKKKKKKEKRKRKKKNHVVQGRGQKQDIRVSLFVLLIYGNLSTFFVPVLFAIKTNYFTDLIYI